MALFGKKNNGQDSSDGSANPAPAGVSEAKDPSAPAPAAPAQSQPGGAPGFQPRPGSPAAAKPSPAGDKPAAPAMGVGTSHIGAKVDPMSGPTVPHCYNRAKPDGLGWFDV